MKTKDLILIGASGVAHEIIDTVFDINDRAPTWNLIWILDDDISKTNCEFYRGIRVIGTSRLISQHDLSEINFLITFSSPATFLNRETFVASLIETYPTIQFATLIHPSAYVSKTASVGLGVFLSVGVVIDSNAAIGDHAIILFYSVMSRFVSVGKFSFVSAGVNIIGHRAVGKNVYIGAKCTINADISDNVFIDSSAFIKNPISENSVVSVKTELNLINYKTSEILRTILGKF